MTKTFCALAVSLFASLVGVQLAHAQQVSTRPNPPFSNLKEYVSWVQATHKAPFHRDGVRLPLGAVTEILRQQAQEANATPRVSGTGHNIKVNKDQNPWPKTEIAVGVDPLKGNIVVMSNDFRENWDHMFYHVSRNGGTSWSDDALTGGNDAPLNGGQGGEDIPLTFESDPGVAFDDLRIPNLKPVPDGDRG